MKILVTGAYGFIGKHLCLYLESKGHEVLKYGSQDKDLTSRVNSSDFIFHLAGVNRTDNDHDFQNVNYGLTEELILALNSVDRKIPIVFASSYQAILNTPYGVSKKRAEDALLKYQKGSNVPVIIYRLPGIFGKWSKPFYNTVVATFIHQAHHNLDLTVHDSNTQIEIAYIDDVVSHMTQHIIEKCEGSFFDVTPTYKVKLGDLAVQISNFKTLDKLKIVPDLSHDFIKKLYSTYISFMPINNIKQPLDLSSDDRGSFTEIIKNEAFGQVSINVTKPGIEKGHHYHHHKHEKFIVVSGFAEIRLRDFYSNEVYLFKVDGNYKQIINIPAGYVHSIKNVGEFDLITMMWANEMFNPKEPDTYVKKV